MPKILSPKDVAGTTRFFIDFDLTSTMIIQLLKEFKSDFPKIQSTANSLKLINRKEKKAIEISDNYISIFPELNQNETESFRKRIYKHIARRSEVYFGTSIENLNLSISSLLTDDLRSCASLLYYALHKFINGEMYNFFNTNLDLEEHEIEFKEIEHFTSSNFNNYVKKISKINKAINKENYHKVLCISRNRCFDPFILSEIIIPSDIIENSEGEFQSYIEFLCVNLFDLSLNSSGIQGVLKNELDIFYKKNQEKATTQEEEVKAAIAYSLLKYKENENELIWLFFVLTLRLYWLRQTADYEFDFEVKTSVREMSMLVSSLKYFFDIQKEKFSDHSKLNNVITENEGIANDAFTINRKKEDVLETVESDNLGLLFYNVNAKFPSDIIFNEEITAFLTGVHLDPYFSQDYVIKALNLTENVSNRGKYFIYENKGALNISLYVHINSEGRWTAWVPKDSYQVSILAPSELIEIFSNFWKSFNKSYSEYFGDQFDDFILATSEPIYVKNTLEISSESIGVIDKAALERKYNFVNLLTRKANQALKVRPRNGKIQIEDLSIYLNVTFRAFDYSQLIPFPTIFFNKALQESEKFAYINFLVIDDEDKFDEMFHTSMNIVDDLKTKHNFDNTIEQNFVIKITSEQIDDFVEGNNREPFLKGITDCLNTIAYERIMNGDYKGAEKFIETCMQFPFSGSFPIATKGLWYLRNEELELNESEKKGIYYYEKALDIEETEVNHLKQKFYYELARFYFYRKRDFNTAASNVNLAKELGETGYFYKDVIELMAEFPNDILMDRTASTTSSEEMQGENDNNQE